MHSVGVMSWLKTDLAAKIAGTVVVILRALPVAARANLTMKSSSLPYFQGMPERQQVHRYSDGVDFVLHTASGDGLHAATTGKPASFNIGLVGETWSPSSAKFIYVWIASRDQILTAEVVDHKNGTLTATYESHFPGEYEVFIEEIEVAARDEGKPFANSPFSLNISGAPTLNVSELAVCGTTEENTEDSFWRQGTWISSKFASEVHGVTRNGWIFQPTGCVYDAFTYDDLMLLASLKKQTWLLVVGGSVQRGAFLTLVDMVLRKEEKANMQKSVLQKCWGYADVQLGNLRLTYQDLRLYAIRELHEDLVVCNDEKLLSGSSAAFLQSCEDFLASTVFNEDTLWPTVILAPAFLKDDDNSSNVAIEVLMRSLPKNWSGRLFMVEHMSAWGYHWAQENPTAATLKGVGMRHARERAGQSYDGSLERFRRYHERDFRVKFLSAFPMQQSRLFENEDTFRFGRRVYGGSQHYHKVWPSDADSQNTYDGSRMVQSTMTDMLATIMIGLAVGTKRSLYEEAARVDPSSFYHKTFQVCADCPLSLVPFHVKPIPEPICETTQSLVDQVTLGSAWNNELCPSWCMKKPPVSRTPTQSGLVDVRECPLSDAPSH